MKIRQVMGVQSTYTNELADELCERIASGRSIVSVCADDDMPKTTTVYRWVDEHPGFRDKIARARDIRLDGFAEDIRDIADKVMADASLDPQRANAAVNAIDKAARLMKPKTYVELTGANGGPIETKDVTARDLLTSRLAGLLEPDAAQNADSGAE